MTRILSGICGLPPSGGGAAPECSADLTARHPDEFI